MKRMLITYLFGVVGTVMLIGCINLTWRGIPTWQRIGNILLCLTGIVCLWLQIYFHPFFIFGVILSAGGLTFLPIFDKSSNSRMKFWLINHTFIYVTGMSILALILILYLFSRCQDDNKPPQSLELSLVCRFGKPVELVGKADKLFI